MSLETAKPKAIELYSPQYFAACTVGGALACGPTHALVTPLDLVKCRSQVQPNLYKGVFDGWRIIYRAEGLRGVFTGFGPTLVGYSLQGMGKYGFYEFFKHDFTLLAEEEKAHKYRFELYLAASAAAEVAADVLLCPMEALKVRMQTSYPPFASSSLQGFQRIWAEEGLKGFYKGLSPLWARQVPYTMMKFATFESTVELIYDKVLQKPKSEYSKLQQLDVSFVAGYAAGILCALVSHPADVLVSKLNDTSGKAGGISSVIRELGWSGVWRGLGPRIAMVGTLTGLQWLTYDTFKVAVGLPTTGASNPSKTDGSTTQLALPAMAAATAPQDQQ